LACTAINYVLRFVGFQLTFNLAVVLVLGRRLARLETRSFSDSLYDRLGSLILRPSNIGTDPFITGLSPLLTALPVGHTNPIRLELIHFSRGHQ
jgi:hypothetical protein